MEVQRRSSWLVAPPGCVSVREAAERLGCSPTYVQQLLLTGRLDERRVATERGRERVWVTETSIAVQRQRRTERNRRFPAADATTAPPRSAERAGALARMAVDRDRWRDRALRAEEAHRLRLLADADVAKGEAARARAEQLLRQHAEAVSEYSSHLLAATRHYAAALAAFSAPSDLSDLTSERSTGSGRG